MKLTPASYNQLQIETCSHLLVFCTDTDFSGLLSDFKKMLLEGGVSAENVEGYLKMIRGMSFSIGKEKTDNWLSKQVYLAVANAINGAKALGLDSCPMEGFDAVAYSKILNLPENFVPTVVVPVGYAADKPKPKLRYPLNKILV